MMASYSILFLCILLLVVGITFSRTFMQIDITAYGLLFGAFYFLFFPLVFLILTGQLSVPWWLVNNNIGLNDVIVGQHDQAFLYLLFYIIGIFILFALLRFKKQKNNNPEDLKIDNSLELRIYYISIVSYIAVSIYILFSSNLLAGGHWYDSRELYIQETGSLAVIAYYLVWALRLIIVAYSFELLERKRISLIAVLVIILAMCSYELAFVGNRIIVVMFGVTGLLYVFKNYGIRKLITIGMLLVPIALVLAIYSTVRSLLFIAPFSQIIESLFSNLGNTAILSTLLSVFEYSDTVVVMNLFTDIGHSIAPVYGTTFLRLFTWFIPRNIWPDRPLNLSLQVGALYTPGVAPAVFTFGEFQFNFAQLGLLFFPLFIFLFLIFRTFIISKLSYKFYFSFVLGFLMFRFPISEIITMVIISVLFYGLIKFTFPIMLPKQFSRQDSKI